MYTLNATRSTRTYYYVVYCSFSLIFSLSNAHFVVLSIGSNNTLIINNDNHQNDYQTLWIDVMDIRKHGNEND